MNIFRKLLVDASVRVERFFHREDEAHHDPEEETADGYTVNFVEHGCYEMYVGKKNFVVDRQKVFVTHPAMIFRYNHFETVPTDVSLSLSFADDFADDVFSTTDFDVRNLPPVVQRTNRLAYLEWQISRLIETNDDLMAIETVAGELFAAVGSQTNQAQPYKTKQLGWYAERVAATCEIIETRFAEPHSLASLSRFVGMSSFHFTRVFKELTGLPPHRFLLKIRLSNAARQLLEGVSVTDVCFNCGFTNLSHFIRLFCRSYGVSPSRFQKQKLKNLSIHVG